MNRLSKDRIKKMCLYARDVIYCCEGGYGAMNITLNNQSTRSIAKFIESQESQAKNVFIMSVIKPNVRL